MGMTDLLDDVNAIWSEDPRRALHRLHGRSPEHLHLQQLSEPTAEATTMDTLGSLIDKLITVNLKMWHNQETLYEIRRMNTREFFDRWEGDLDGLHEVIKRCCDLNVQRNRLIDEIDRYMKRVAAGVIEAEDLVREQHKTY